MKLTARSAAALKLPTGKNDHIEFDDALPGFGLRLRKGGSRTWVYQYSIGTKQRRIALGKVSALTVEKAREVAGNLHAKVRLGGDPAADKAASKVAAAMSFKVIVERYLAFKEKQMKPRSYDQVEHHLLKKAKTLHGMPIATVDKRAIADLLSDVAVKSGTVTANRARASLSALFTWAMKEGLADANPVANTNKREEKSRNRVLDDDNHAKDNELATIWAALEDNHYGDIIKLLLLTGQRENEIGSLCWSEINFEKDVISLPGSRTKNGLPHDVPMSGPVRNILKRQKKTEGREFVFGYAEGPFSGWSKSKERFDKRILEARKEAAKKAGADPSKVEPLDHWTIHDLRRTVSTKMGDIGIPPHIVEAVLNHISGQKGGVAGVYNKSLYTAEKGQALARWAEYLTSVVEGRERKVLKFPQTTQSFK
jgi:integrase